MDQTQSPASKHTPRRPTQARSIQTYEKIMGAGEKLFIRDGFHNILADDIAREAGVSVGSFYSYFKDKRAVFITLLEEISKRMLAVINENVNDFLKDDSQDLNPVFYQIMIRLIYVHQKYMPLFQQAQQMAFFDDEIKRYTEQSDAASLLVFEKILQHYLKAEPEYLHAKAYVIFYASEGIIHNISSSNLSEAEREKILTESVRLFSGYFLSLIDQK